MEFLGNRFGWMRGVGRMGIVKMYYVYLLRSKKRPLRTYVGFSEELRGRVGDHNAGRNVSTKPFRPWTLEAYLAFSDREQALEFERYLKTSAGKAFAKKRIWSSSMAG
jgi:putative endonuclease